MAGAAELEHFCGYGGRHLGTVRLHPTEPGTLIYAAAAAVIIEDVNDPHKQEFLRGHDAEVSAIDVSLDGRLVASGQQGSPSRKGAVAPVVVWDFGGRERCAEFGGLAQAALCLQFSPDGRFLAAAGGNQMLLIWDVATREAVFSRRTESPCSLAAWGRVEDPAGRYPSYQLCTAHDSQVFVHQMAFDIRTMCYGLTSELVQVPSSGLQRRHACGLVVAGGDSLITGTSTGDMCVFSLRANVFRTAASICNNGVTSLAQCGDTIYAGGGDGRVRALRGHDTQWDTLAENVLETGVTALTPSCDGTELVAGTRNGKLWRLLASDLTATLQAVSHTGGVTDVSFGPSSDVVCTTSEAGEALLLDLSDYMPVAAASARSPARSAVLTAATGSLEMLVAYDDGALRAWSASSGSGGGHLLWQLDAHRGGITVVKDSPDFIVSSGNDRSVRFWHRTSRELLASFANHRKPISDLKVDEASPHLVHSGSEDRLVVTYDVRAGKTLVQHQAPGSGVTGLSQRKDHEREVVSSSLDGKILFWDVDYPDPTGCLEGLPPGRAGQLSARLRCCEVSPSGRYIAAGSDDAMLYIYDLVSCSCIQECEGHAGGVTRVRWSPDQKQIVSGGRDGCVIVWNFFEP